MIAQINTTACMLITTFMLSSAVFVSSAAMAQNVSSEATSSEVAMALQSIQLDVDGRQHRIQLDIQRARGFSVDMRASKPTLSDETKHALREMMRNQTMKAVNAGRFVVLGSNDEYSATGRAGRAGFLAAKSIRDFLISEGMQDERIVVAGWQAAAQDAGALSTLGSGGRVVVAPIGSDEARRVISIHGDPGRALAFDSAFSRLTLARAAGDAQRGPVIANAPATTLAPANSSPANSSPANSSPAKPLDVRPAPQVVISAPRVQTPARQDYAVRGPVQAVLPSVPVPYAGLVQIPPMNMAPVHVQIQPQLQPHIQQAAGRCAPPVMALDDYYPGGPIVACGKNHPSERRRPVY